MNEQDMFAAMADMLRGSNDEVTNNLVDAIDNQTEHLKEKGNE